MYNPRVPCIVTARLQKRAHFSHQLVIGHVVLRSVRVSATYTATYFEGCPLEWAAYFSAYYECVGGGREGVVYAATFRRVPEFSPGGCVGEKSLALAIGALGGKYANARWSAISRRLAFLNLSKFRDISFKHCGSQNLRNPLSTCAHFYNYFHAFTEF